MGQRRLLLLTAVIAAGGIWLSFDSGQWHYLAVVALAPIVWLAGRR